VNADDEANIGLLNRNFRRLGESLEHDLLLLLLLLLLLDMIGRRSGKSVGG
jgi:hypothetical protein